MDIATVKSKIPLNCSEAHWDLFKYLILKDHDSRKTTSWEWLMSDLSPYKADACKKNWRKKFNLALERGDNTLVDFLIECHLAEIAPDRDKEYRQMLEQLDSPLTLEEKVWMNVEGYLLGFREKVPLKHPSSIVLQYYLAESRRCLSYIESILWMLISYNEFSMVASGHPIGVGNQDSGSAASIDLLGIIPAASADGLTSTRYQVIDSFLNSKAHVELDENGARILREQRGTKYWNAGDKHRTGFSVNAIDRVIDLESIGIPIDAKPDIKISVREYFRRMLYFVGFFEVIQYELLARGIKSDEIVQEFRRYPSLKDEFYTGLTAFSEKIG